MHTFVSNLNNGGYVLVEADDPGVVYSFVSKFVYWNDVTVVPVVDVADGVAHGVASLAWARSTVKRLGSGSSRASDERSSRDGRAP